jgi:hypothetical protein
LATAQVEEGDLPVGGQPTLIVWNGQKPRNQLRIAKLSRKQRPVGDDQLGASV